MSPIIDLSITGFKKKIMLKLIEKISERSFLLINLWRQTKNYKREHSTIYLEFSISMQLEGIIPIIPSEFRALSHPSPSPSAMISNSSFSRRFNSSTLEPFNRINKLLSMSPITAAFVYQVKENTNKMSLSSKHINT